MQNVGTPDRIVRVAVGVILVALPFLAALSGWAFWVSLVLGIVLIGTAAFSFCPIYAMLGLSSRRKPQA
ncbi:YgaP family membrane protein [Devosia sp.]|uniref:YgaP family membrane protein n=1 Tax=Devosia sp. TaxID=1871048 RepID=UPI002F08CB5D